MNAIVRTGRFMATAAVVIVLVTGGVLIGQTRDKGPWWPSTHGLKDQAGNSNYITPDKIVKALQLAKTGQVYELGHMYERGMPDGRSYFVSVTPQSVEKDGQFAGHQEFFAGYIGQMGTSYDSLGHQGRGVRMADGTLMPTYYNGFTEKEMTSRSGGAAGLEALGIETMKPIITRGVLIDVAAYKGVPTLEAGYEVTAADLRAALAKQGISENSIERGDAILLHYGWGTKYWRDAPSYGNTTTKVPGINLEAASWLRSKGVAMVGADSCCVQAMPWPGNFVHTVHHELLLNGVFILENMDLETVARDRVYEFLYVGPALRIKGGTGSPVRPLAIR